MKKILKNRVNLVVSKLQEVEGNWEVALELEPKVEQSIFVAGFIRNNNEYKLTKFPIEVHSYTHKLQPALIDDARVELINNKGCELRIFNKKLSSYDAIIIRLMSRLRDFYSNDDLITHYIELEIPIPNRELVML